MVDRELLKALTEAPSIGTACGPVWDVLGRWFGEGYTKTLVPDGFCLFQKAGASPADLRTVFVSHVDEVGGCVLGPMPAERGGGYLTRHWGTRAGVYASSRLQAFDYLAETGAEAYRVESSLALDGSDVVLALHGERVRAYRTGWTYLEETTFPDDTIEGKALDPRVTAYCVGEAVRRLDDGSVGALYVMGEECAMDVARKAVTFLTRHAPNLQLVANADVPGLTNLRESRLDLPAIRVFERNNFIDPAFGIATAERLQSQGLHLHLTGAKSGSQTILFTPLAPTLSIALPADGIHLPRVRMSLTGIERCTALLEAVAEG